MDLVGCAEDDKFQPCGASVGRFENRQVQVYILWELDKSVSMPVGSRSDGAGSFSLLAGDDDDAGHSGPAVCAIAA